LQRGEETDWGGKAQVERNSTYAQRGEEMNEVGKAKEVMGNVVARI
jgi:hypothetical protein